MTTNAPLTEAILEAALVRRAARVSGNGLRDEIMAAVARTPQVRRPLLAPPSWLAWPAPPRRLVLVVAVSGLLLALLGSILLVGGRLLTAWPRHPATLVPTGIELLTPANSLFDDVVADPEGMIWGYGSGILARFDPASGALRTWTQGADAAFGFSEIGAFVPARGGGVWFGSLSGGMLRWFDGERFRDVVPPPPVQAVSLVEGPDGSLWAGGDTGLFRWDGTAWSAAPEGRPTVGVSAVAVDGSGAVWVGNAGSPSPAARSLGVSRYDGTRWDTFANPPAGSVNLIEPAVDGSIWVVTDSGLAQYDSRGWTDESTPPIPGCDRPFKLTTAPDGKTWVSCVGTSASSPTLASYDGSGWAMYGPAEGLPWAWFPRVVATSRGVFTPRADGLYRLAGSRWERTLSLPSTSSGPQAPQDIVGVSRDEVWALDELALNGRAWRYANGAWTVDPAVLPSPVYDLAQSPNGNLLAASSAGVAIRRDGQWAVLGGGPASVLAPGPGGTVWLAGDPRLGHIRGIRLDDPATVLSVPDPPGWPASWAGSLAVGADGSLWAGLTRASPSPTPGSQFYGLYHYVDGRWERVLVPTFDRPEQRGVGSVAVAPNGDVWVVWPGVIGDSGEGPATVTRFDGATWTSYGIADGLPAVGRDAWGEEGAVAVGPDGTVWATTGQDLVRFDGTRWTVIARGAFSRPLSVAPDGTVFVAEPSRMSLTRVVDSGRR
jgi:hypothetical protein